MDRENKNIENGGNFVENALEFIKEKESSNILKIKERIDGSNVTNYNVDNQILLRFLYFWFIKCVN